MQLSPAQESRVTATLLGTAVGDALGVPYEFGRRLEVTEIPEMIGGGLGDFAPGEWSDDTSMAVAVAEAVAAGHDLTSEAGLDAVAQRFLRWYTDFDCSPPDIGIQTRAVLGATHRRMQDDPTASAGAAMTEESLAFAAEHPHSAGNGALMRTAPVALAHLDDRETLAEAARAVAGLTHSDDLARESCVLWCEAIRAAILEEHIDIAAGLDLLPPARRYEWARLLGAAAQQDPLSFSPNGFTVTALQAAASAILHANQDETHLVESLRTAIRIGDDTDTVAAIAGGLLGARWGVNAIPQRYADAVHGWPYASGVATNASDLGRMASAVKGLS